ncbi:hypothetical protein L6452_03225 [Arctium lappa]|uniref:Uncharacterized protein n=1 Tax=Arctium lappa TaxID=4217 RepID=A0ACB9FMK0_ARCLA|nr:hypothetical protein L6452_03225 [Arctium lappa]
MSSSAQTSHPRPRAGKVSCFRRAKHECKPFSIIGFLCSNQKNHVNAADSFSSGEYEVHDDIGKKIFVGVSGGPEPGKNVNGLHE